MSEHEQKLLQLGFRVDGDGTLVAPGATRITLKPTDGHFFRLTLALPHGGELSCIVAQVGLKLTPPRERDIDITTLIAE
ncbi:MAG TPA: hypothetical protein VKE42_07380 [Candidatus Cybelea sp.]|nr:hypothetical protein [Candidatus Cybelea sp.]